MELGLENRLVGQVATRQFPLLMVDLGMIDRRREWEGEEELRRGVGEYVEGMFYLMWNLVYALQ